MSPYDVPGSNKPQKAVEPCEHCGQDDEPVHPVHSGGGILILCASCRSEVVGGS